MADLIKLTGFKNPPEPARTKINSWVEDVTKDTKCGNFHVKGDKIRMVKYMKQESQLNSFIWSK